MPGKTESITPRSPYHHPLTTQSEMKETLGKPSEKVIPKPESLNHDQTHLADRNVRIISEIKATCQALSEQLAAIKTSEQTDKPLGFKATNSLVSKHLEQASEALDKALKKIPGELKTEIAVTVNNEFTSLHQRLKHIHTESHAKLGLIQKVRKKKLAKSKLKHLKIAIQDTINKIEPLLEKSEKNNQEILSSDQKTPDRDREIYTKGILATKPINLSDEHKNKIQHSPIYPPQIPEHTESKALQHTKTNAAKVDKKALKSALKKFKPVDSNLGSLLKVLKNSKGDEIQKAIDAINSYIEIKKDQMSGLSPIIDCMSLWTTITENRSNKPLELQNSLLILKNIEPVTLNPDTLIERLSEFDNQLQILSELDSNNETAWDILCKEQPKEKTQQSLFTTLLFKTFLSQDQHLPLSQRKMAPFKHMTTILEAMTLSLAPKDDRKSIMDLQSAALTDKKLKDKVIACIETPEELLSFLSIYNEHLIANKLRDNLNETHTNLIKLDNELPIPESTVTQVSEAASGLHSLEAIHRATTNTIEQESADDTSIPTKEIIKDHAQQVGIAVDKINTAIANHEKNTEIVKKAVEKQVSLFSKIHNNNNEVFERLTTDERRIKDEAKYEQKQKKEQKERNYSWRKFIPHSLHTRLLETGILKSPNLATNEESDQEELEKLEDKKGLKRVQQIKLLFQNTPNSVAEARRQLNSAHLKIINCRAEGIIEESRCTELLSLLFISQQALSQDEEIVDTKETTLSKDLEASLKEKLATDSDTKTPKKKKDSTKEALSKKEKEKEKELILIKKSKNLVDTVKTTPITKQAFRAAIDDTLKEISMEAENNDSLVDIKRQLTAYRQERLHEKDTTDQSSKAASEHSNATTHQGSNTTRPTSENHIQETDRIIHHLQNEKKKTEDDESNINLSKKAVRATQSLLDLYSCLDDTSGVCLEHKKELEDNINTYHRLLEMHTTDGHDDQGKAITSISLLKAATKALSSSKDLEKAITYKDLTFTRTPDKALSYKDIEKLCSIATTREKYIRSGINATSELDPELHKDLTTMFGNSVIPAPVTDEAQPASYIDKLKAQISTSINNNQVALADILFTIEDSLNGHIIQILENEFNNKPFDNLKKGLLKKKQVKQLNIKKATEILSDFENSPLSQYFDINFDNMTITAKQECLTDTELEEFNTKNRKLTKQEKDNLLRSESIKKHLATLPVKSYDLGFFIESLKAEIAKKNKMKEPLKFYLTSAPSIWPDVFLSNEAGHYSTLQIKNLSIGKSLTEKVCQFQSDIFNALWKHKLPSGRIDLFKEKRLITLKLKEREALKNAMLEKLNNIAGNIKEDPFILKKEKKLALIKKSTAVINAIDITTPKFATNINNILAKLCSDYEKSIPFYSVSVPTHLIELEKLGLSSEHDSDEPLDIPKKPDSFVVSDSESSDLRGADLDTVSESGSIDSGVTDLDTLSISSQESELSVEKQTELLSLFNQKAGIYPADDESQKSLEDAMHDLSNPADDGFNEPFSNGLDDKNRLVIRDDTGDCLFDSDLRKNYLASATSNADEIFMVEYKSSLEAACMDLTKEDQAVVSGCMTPLLFVPLQEALGKAVSSPEQELTLPDLTRVTTITPVYTEQSKTSLVRVELTLKSEQPVFKHSDGISYQVDQPLEARVSFTFNPESPEKVKVGNISHTIGYASACHMVTEVQ